MNKQNKKNGQKGKGQSFSQPRRQPQGSLLKVALSRATRSVNSNIVKSSIGVVRMSSCAGKLAAAIADPFSEDATGACFPVFPAPDSHKVQAFSRFDGAIGTAGVGFILLTPSLANDLPSAYATTAAFTGSILKPLSADSTLAPGVVKVQHNGPYSASQLVRTNGVTESILVGRLVAAGVRVTYTGTELNLSGVCTSLVHPTHGNLSGAAISDLQSFGNADICPFTRKPCELVISPANIQNTAYSSTESNNNTKMVYPFSHAEGRFYQTFNGTLYNVDINTVDTVQVDVGNAMAAVMVTGVAGSTFHVDIVYHLEYTGKTAAASLTPNSVDVSSVYAILTAAQQLATRKMAHPQASSWKLLMDGVQSALGSPVGLTARGIVGIK